MNDEQYLDYEYTKAKYVELQERFAKVLLEKERLFTRTLPSAIRYDKDKVQTSPDDQMSKIVAEINALETEMAEVQLLKTQQIEKIELAVNSLESDEERTALTMRYINRRPIAEIADDMGYSEPTIYRFMRQGRTNLLRLI